MIIVFLVVFGVSLSEEIDGNYGIAKYDSPGFFNLIANGVHGVFRSFFSTSIAGYDLYPDMKAIAEDILIKEGVSGLGMEQGIGVGISIGAPAVILLFFWLILFIAVWPWLCCQCCQCCCCPDPDPVCRCCCWTDDEPKKCCVWCTKIANLVILLFCAIFGIVAVVASMQFPAFLSDVEGAFKSFDKELKNVQGVVPKISGLFDRIETTGLEVVELIKENFPLRNARDFVDSLELTQTKLTEYNNDLKTSFDDVKIALFDGMQEVYDNLQWVKLNIEVNFSSGTWVAKFIDDVIDIDSSTFEDAVKKLNELYRGAIEQHANNVSTNVNNTANEMMSFTINSSEALNHTL